MRHVGQINNWCLPPKKLLLRLPGRHHQIFMHPSEQCKRSTNLVKLSTSPPFFNWFSLARPLSYTPSVKDFTNYLDIPSRSIFIRWRAAFFPQVRYVFPRMKLLDRFESGWLDFIRFQGMRWSLPWKFY